MADDRIDTVSLLAGIDLVALIGRRVDLERQGTEYRGPCPFHEGKDRNFAVVPSKGFYHCHVCGENGDAITWTMHWQAVPFREACSLLGSGLTTGKTRKDPPKRITAKPPKGAAPPEQPSRWGRPVRRWLYLDATGDLLFAVDRYEYEEDGKTKKITPQVTWGSRDNGETWGWALGHYQTPRPLYGLDQLAAKPQAQVMIVEGEKACDAARQLLPSWVVITWPGGGGAVDHADWSPLAGRDVVLWPDADSQAYRTGEKEGQPKPYEEQPGTITMERLGAILHESAARVRLLDVRDHKDGWDAADAVEEGWDTKRTYEWAKSRLVQFAVPETPAPTPLAPTPIQRGPLKLTKGGAAPEPEPEPEEPKRTGFQWWLELELATTSKGIPHTNLDNIVRVLTRHPATAGKLWFDRFYRRAYTSSPVTGPEAHEVSDADVLALTVWLQRDLGLFKVADSLVGRAVTSAAASRQRSEPDDWLRSLQWDGVRRLPEMMARYFGAAASDYTCAVGQNFMRGMVARVLTPGCQMDNMVILEGKQGTYKNSALRALAGRWYTENRHSVDSPNFYTTLHGKMLIDFSEFATFATADVRKVKQAITVTTDRFRMPYAHRDEDFPRQCVFIATTNETDTLRDPTGARRFWPIRCSVITVEAITRDRSQLFAEAVADVLAGQPWHLMPDTSTRREQMARRQVDAWEPMVHRYIAKHRVTGADGTYWLDRDMPLTSVTVGDILQFGLDVPLAKWGRLEQRRVIDALLAMGWEAEAGSLSQRFHLPGSAPAAGVNGAAANGGRPDEAGHGDAWEPELTEG